MSWALLQFQTPERSAGIRRSGNDYTLTRGIGQNRTWEVDLVWLDGAVDIHVLKGSRIVNSAGPTTTTLQDSTSVWEYALNVAPSGQSSDFLGNGHGGDRETGFSVEVDGQPVALADGASSSGQTVEVTRTSELLYSGSVIATIEVVYTMTHLGLDVDTTITWAADLVSSQCYTAMMPANAVLDTGRVFGASSVSLTADNGAQNGKLQTHSAWLWDADGNHGAILYLRDYDGVANWTKTDNKNLWVQDRTAPDTVNKVYAGLNPGTIATGEVWHSRWRVVADYFDGGAANSLNR